MREINSSLAGEAQKFFLLYPIFLKPPIFSFHAMRNKSIILSHYTLGFSLVKKLIDSICSFKFQPQTERLCKGSMCYVYSWLARRTYRKEEY